MSTVQPNIRKNTTGLNTAIILSALCIPLMILQSTIGLTFPGSYAKDGAWGRAVWLGNDVVNLFIFTPLLLIAILLYKRGSAKGILFWLGVQALITYDYLYYPLAVAYDTYFLLYVAILGISFYSFLFGITGMDISEYEKYIPGKKSTVIASGLMLTFALILGLMWTGLWVYFIFTGEEKQKGLAMISTFDFILIITPMVLSAFWLLKGQSRGYVLSTIMTLICGFYCLILMAFTPFALRAHLPDAWTLLPLWVLLCALCFPAMIILLKSRRSE